jgi:HEXXH motif-containing protein
LPDAGGACLPGPPGQALDQAAALWAQSLHQRALALCKQAIHDSSGWLGRYLEQLHNKLAELAPEQALAAFRPALAGLVLSPEHSAARPLETALGLVRFLVGGPNQGTLGLTLPAQAFGSQGRLYFPHLHTLVESHGPLALEGGFDQVRLTWVDGAGATLDAEPPQQDPGQSGPRLWRFPSVGGWRVLNGCPDLALPIPELPVAPSPEADAVQLDNLSNGAELLRRVWPAAASAARRYLDSVVLQPLPEAGHVTSVTLGRLQGSLIASLRDPVQVGDALCHEGSHTRLGLLLHLDPLLQDEGAAIHPSPWRQDPRPLKGLLNGVHAFVNVCEYYRRLAATEPILAAAAEDVRELQRDRVLEAWDYLQSRAQPTALGQFVMDDLAAAVEFLR